MNYVMFLRDLCVMNVTVRGSLGVVTLPNKIIKQ